MIEKVSNIQQVTNVLEVQLKIMNKRLSEYERNIVRLLKMVEAKNSNTKFREVENCDIKIRSYMD